MSVLLAAVVAAKTGDSFSPRPSPGTPLHIALAWSHDDDFDHHSAMRERVAVVFP